MGIGKWNRSLGWLWIAVTLLFGMYSATKLEHWMMNDMGMTRSMFRHAHTMGIIAAVINVAYGMRIEDMPLGDGLKKAGGVLALLGMVGITLIWPASLYGVPAQAAALVGLVLIAAVVIAAYGEFQGE